MSNNRIMGIVISTLCLCCISWTTTKAEQATYSQTFIPDGTRASAPVPVPKFDPAKGELFAVEIAITSELSGDVMGQSRETGESEVKFVITGDVLLKDERGELLLQVQPQATLTEVLQGTFIESDGATSGHLVVGQSVEQTINATAVERVQLIEPTILQRFQGDGELNLLIESVANGKFSGPGNVIGAMNVSISAEIGVTYHFDTYTASTENDADATLPDGNSDADDAIFDNENGNGSDTPEVGEEIGDPVQVKDNRIYVPLFR